MLPDQASGGRVTRLSSRSRGAGRPVDSARIQLAPTVESDGQGRRSTSRRYAPSTNTPPRSPATATAVGRLVQSPNLKRRPTDAGAYASPAVPSTQPVHAGVVAPDESEKLVVGLGGLLLGQQSSHQRASRRTVPSGHDGSPRGREDSPRAGRTPSTRPALPVDAWSSSATAVAAFTTHQQRPAGCGADVVVPSGSEALRPSTTAPLLGRRRLPQPHRLRKQHGDGARRNSFTAVKSFGLSGDSRASTLHAHMSGDCPQRREPPSAARPRVPRQPSRRQAPGGTR